MPWVRRHEYSLAYHGDAEWEHRSIEKTGSDDSLQ